MTLADRYQRALRESLEEITEELLKESRDLAPVMEPGEQRPGTGYPGQLRDSARATVTDVPGGFLGTVSYDTPYAVKQHENLRLEHDNGKGKFLADPLKALTPRLQAELGRRIREKLADG